jgi:hypothetical protein
MSVHKKLNEARLKFHAMPLKKSGRNTFAKYNYFELGDFLVPALQIFNDVGLCATISFSDAYATMHIVDVDDGSQIVINSPMGSANLKGCHEIQNIGACETYSTRYLWVAALQIVEHDALDATTGSAKAAPAKTAKLVSDGDAVKLQQLLKATSTPAATILKHYKADNLKQLSADNAADAIERLEAKLAKLAKAETEAKAGA